MKIQGHEFTARQIAGALVMMMEEPFVPVDLERRLETLGVPRKLGEWGFPAMRSTGALLQKAKKKGWASFNRGLIGHSTLWAWIGPRPGDADFPAVLAAFGISGVDFEMAKGEV